MAEPSQVDLRCEPPRSVPFRTLKKLRIPGTPALAALKFCSLDFLSRFFFFFFFFVWGTLLDAMRIIPPHEVLGRPTKDCSGHGMLSAEQDARWGARLVK